MRNINANELDIFQISSLKEILDERAEYYSKSIPDYALLVHGESNMTPNQRAMLDKYNVIKQKSATLAAMIENYILNDLLNEKN